MKKFTPLQLTGAILVIIGVLRLFTASVINGATWILLGVSFATYKLPLATDGTYKWHTRSIIAYASGLAAIGLMLYYVIAR